jgi:excisionase family DNA binding protein
MEDRPIRDGTNRPPPSPPQAPSGLQLDLAPFAERVAQHVVEVVLKQIEIERRSPWMLMEEAIAYTRVPAGTFRKWVADGRIPAHGGKRKLFHRDELDAALGYGSPEPSVLPAVPLRRRA